MKKVAFILLEHPINDGITRVFDKLMNFLNQENKPFDVYKNENLSYIPRGFAIIHNFLKLRKNLHKYNVLIIQSKKDTYLLLLLLQKKIKKNQIKIKLLHMDIHNNKNPHFDTTTKYMTFLETRIFKICDVIYFMNEEHFETYNNYETSALIEFEMFMYFEKEIKNEFMTNNKKIFYAGLLDEARYQVLEKFAKELFLYDPDYIIEIYGSGLHDIKNTILTNVILKNEFIDLNEMKNIKFIQKNYSLSLSITVSSSMFPSKIRGMYSYNMPFVNITSENGNSSLQKEVELVGGYFIYTDENINFHFLKELKKPENGILYTYNSNKKRIIDLISY